MRIYKRISLPPSSCGCWCCCFPSWLSLSGNAISFLSGEDGAAVLLCTLLTENYGAVPVRDASDLSFLRGDGLPLEARSPAALLTGLIFTIMPTVDFLKTEILKEHFLLGICCWQKMQTASPHFFLR